MRPSAQVFSPLTVPTVMPNPDTHCCKSLLEIGGGRPYLVSMR
jgi:hypothetical protein